jgi:hypothetical protein
MASFILEYFNIIVGLGVLLMFVLIYLSCIAKKHSVLDRFVDKLDIIIGIFAVIGVILTYSVFRRNLEQASIETTFQIVDRAWTDINKEFHKSYKSCPNLINSLFFDWQIKAFGGDITLDSFKGHDEWHAVNLITCLIFQSVEDMMTSSSFDESGEFVWLANGIQWFSSPILQKIWLTQKSNYVETSQNLIDLVISKCKNRNNIKNINDLDLVVKEIINTDEYKRIVSKRDQRRDIL